MVGKDSIPTFQTPKRPSRLSKCFGGSGAMIGIKLGNKPFLSFRNSQLTTLYILGYNFTISDLLTKYISLTF